MSNRTCQICAVPLGSGSCRHTLTRVVPAECACIPLGWGSSDRDACPIHHTAAAPTEPHEFIAARFTEPCVHCGEGVDDPIHQPPRPAVRENLVQMFGPSIGNLAADVVERTAAAPTEQAADELIRAWGEGYAAAMAVYAPGVVPIWRRDANPYRRDSAPAEVPGDAHNHPGKSSCDNPVHQPSAMCATTVGGHPSGMPMPCGLPEGHVGRHGGRIEAEHLPGCHLTAPLAVSSCACDRIRMAAGDAATDVDSTAEVCRCAARMYSHPRGETPCIYREPSAGSPVTAGVPDTAACGCVEGYEWRARQDAVCGNCPRRSETPVGGPDTARIRADMERNQYAEPEDTEALIVALDAARGELVTARGERDALRVELAGVTPEGVEWQYRPWIPPAQRTADDWSSMVAVARNRAWAAEAELAAANARIAAVFDALDGLTDADEEYVASRGEIDSASFDHGVDQAKQEVRDALGVPATGDVP